MKNKIIYLGLLSALMVPALTACGGNEGATNEESSESESLSDKIYFDKYAGSHNAIDVNEAERIITINVSRDVKSFSIYDLKFKSDLGCAVRGFINGEEQFEFLLDEGINEIKVIVENTSKSEEWKLIVNKEKYLRNYIFVSSRNDGLGEYKYYLGDPFKIKKITVTVNEVLETELELTPEMYKDFKTDKIGKFTINFDIDGTIVPYEYEVVSKDILKNVSKISYYSGKLNYLVGEEYENITLLLDNGDKKQGFVVPFNLVSGFNTEHSGECEITITLNDKEFKLKLNVLEASNNTSIYSFNRTYAKGSDFIPGKIKKVVDGEVSLVDITKDMVAGFDTSVLGQHEVTIKYDNVEYKEYINVISSLDTEPIVVPSVLDSNDVLALAKTIKALNSLTNSNISAEEFKALVEKATVDEKYVAKKKEELQSSGISTDKLKSLISFYNSTGLRIAKLLLANPDKGLMALDNETLNEIFKEINKTISIFTIDELAFLIPGIINNYETSDSSINASSKDSYGIVSILLSDAIKLINNKELTDFVNNNYNKELNISSKRNMAIFLNNLSRLASNIDAGSLKLIMNPSLLYSASINEVNRLGSDLHRLYEDELSFKALLSFIKAKDEATYKNGLFEYYNSKAKLSFINVLKKHGDKIATLLDNLNSMELKSIQSFLSYTKEEIHLIPYQLEKKLYSETIITTKALYPLISEIYNDDDFKNIFSYSNKKEIFKLANAFNLINYLGNKEGLDELLIGSDDISYKFKDLLDDYDLGGNQLELEYLFNNGDLIVKKGTSVEDFITILHENYTFEGFIPSQTKETLGDEIINALNVEGLHNLMVAGGNKAGTYIKFYVYDESSDLTPLNNEITTALKDVILYIDSNGNILKAKNINNALTDTYAIEEDIDRLLKEVNLNILLNDSGIVLKTNLNSIDYTYEVVYDNKPGLNLGYLKINTELGSFFAVINYTVVNHKIYNALNRAHNNKIELNTNNSFNISINYGYDFIENVNVDIDDYENTLGVKTVNKTIDGMEISFDIEVIDSLSASYPHSTDLGWKEYKLDLESLEGSFKHTRINYQNACGKIVTDILGSTFLDNLKSYYSNLDNYNVKFSVAQNKDNKLDLHLALYDGNKLIDEFVFKCVEGDVIPLEVIAGYNSVEVDLSLYKDLSDEEVLSLLENKLNNLNVKFKYKNKSFNGASFLSFLKNNKFNYEINFERNDEIIKATILIDGLSTISFSYIDKAINRTLVNDIIISNDLIINSSDNNITSRQVLEALKKSSIIELKYNSILFKNTDINSLEDLGITLEILEDKIIFKFNNKVVEANYTINIVNNNITLETLDYVTESLTKEEALEIIKLRYRDNEINPANIEGLEIISHTIDGDRISYSLKVYEGGIEYNFLLVCDYLKDLSRLGFTLESDKVAFKEFSPEELLAYVKTNAIFYNSGVGFDVFGLNLDEVITKAEYKEEEYGNYIYLTLNNSKTIHYKLEGSGSLKYYLSINNIRLLNNSHIIFLDKDKITDLNYLKAELAKQASFITINYYGINVNKKEANLTDKALIDFINSSYITISATNDKLVIKVGDMEYKISIEYNPVGVEEAILDLQKNFDLTEENFISNITSIEFTYKDGSKGLYRKGEISEHLKITSFKAYFDRYIIEYTLNGSKLTEVVMH